MAMFVLCSCGSRMVRSSEMEADLAQAGQDTHQGGEGSWQSHQCRGNLKPVLVEWLLIILLHTLVGCVCAEKVCASRGILFRSDCLTVAICSVATVWPTLLIF